MHIGGGQGEVWVHKEVGCGYIRRWSGVRCGHMRWSGVRCGYMRRCSGVGT